MTAGEETIEWLYYEQLRVDSEWSVQKPNGFEWWADKNAQTIEVVGEEEFDGDLSSLISVRTDFLEEVDLTEKTLPIINSSLMSVASMAGPVYDSESKKLQLCSLVRVYSDIADWINPLISMASVLQIGEARIMGPVLAETLGAAESFSGHPETGVREVPDEMAGIIATLIAPMGKEPCRWQEEEFQEAVDHYMQQPPSIGASGGGLGFTVEFPYGEEASSICRVMGEQPHPRYGSGLFLLQSFPVGDLSETEGVRLALALNGLNLVQYPYGYGFGSFAFRDGSIHFTSFYPNTVYRLGLLPSFYFACAQRAKEMSIRLTDTDWDEDSFDLRKSALGRLLDEQ